MANEKMSLTPTDIRNKLLKEVGLTPTQKEKRRNHKLKPLPQAVIPKVRKTPMMLYLEEKYKEPVEKVLLSGSLNVVAKHFNGEVDRSTISRWIKRFKLRYDKDNLPQCEGCLRYGPACDSGICYILLELELWELVPIKKQEVLGET